MSLRGGGLLAGNVSSRGIFCGRVAVFSVQKYGLEEIASRGVELRNWVDVRLLVDGAHDIGPG